MGVIAELRSTAREHFPFYYMARPKKVRGPLAEVSNAIARCYDHHWLWRTLDPYGWRRNALAAQRGRFQC